MSVDKISANPACDKKKLFIEVTGIDHGTEHAIQFYDNTDYIQKAHLEGKIETETLSDTTIFSWDWTNEKNETNTWLAVSSDDGVIKLPLYNDVEAKNRVDGEQDYLLHAVLPLTLLPTFNQSLSYKERIAPTRNGYIYIFFNDRAWREIEIRTNEDGTPSFRDIDLFKYRSGRDKPFNFEKRLASGVELNEIWLPARDNAKRSQVNLAYSEIQWSGERLNYFEENQDEMTSRAVAFHKLNVFDTVDVLKAGNLPEIRVREPEIEMVLAEPSSLNHDLSGAWLEKQFKEIKNEVLDCRKDNDKALSLLKYKTSYQYEYGMKQNALKQLLSQDTSNEDLWKTEAKEDFLKDAKARKLRAIVLDDPVFELRHHAFCALYGIGYFQQVHIDMSEQEYFRCAEAVQKLILPKKFGEQENVWFKYKDDVDQYLGGRYHRALRTVERQVCMRDVKAMQAVVKSLLETDRLACVLRDITSLGDINGCAAAKICGYGLSALSINIDALDQMTLDKDKDPLSFADDLLRILTPDMNHPLHAVLFPPKGTVDCENEYKPPKPKNDGSGYACTELITSWFSEWEKANFTIEEDQLEMMDLAFMAEAENNEEDSFGALRRAANVTDNIFKGYFDALQELSKNLAKEAFMVKFDAAYAPVISMMKASNSKYWGKAKYVPFGGNPIEGNVVGVHGQGLSYGITEAERDYVNTQKRKTRLGRLYEQNGKLFASTAKSAFKKGDFKPGLKGPASQHVGAKLPTHVFILPEDSHMAEEFSKEKTQRTLQDLNKSGITKSNVYEKFRVPYFIVVIETINLIKAQNHFTNIAKDKDRVYSITVAVSALLDLSVAITHASNLYTKNASFLAQQSHKTAFSMPKNAKTFVDKISKTTTLVKHISMIGVIGIGAGFLTAGIALWDSIRLFNRHDYDASIAQGIIFAGTLVTTITTGFFTTSAPTLFGMGPAAWLGISIALAGFALYIHFKDSPMEIWLKNGPFRDSPPQKYLHLQDGNIAFNRFIDILFNVSLKMYHISKDTLLPEDIAKTMQLRGATHVIWVDTNLAALLNQNMVKAELFVRQSILQKTTKAKRASILESESSQIIKKDKKNSPILGQEISTNGYAFFVKHDIKIPEANTEFSFWSTTPQAHTYKAAFVARARLIVGETVFPGPNLDESIPTNSRSLSSTPTFEDDEKYWINQIAFSQ
ncbi:hypothetical protein [Enterovibrio calviensis]|uniref:hypothetical protein n=1 Tax=Enterovibrio calviensis TaxID=91359 RepID=UPI0004811E8C|nr:hypothetical protein [Enterovibrio calviensis]